MRLAGRRSQPRLQPCERAQLHPLPPSEQTRQASKIGDVKGTGMSWSVGTDEAGAIDRKTDRQALNRDVMHDLIIGALEERRINGGERFVAFGSKPGGECYRMLFGDADVELRLGNSFANRSTPVPDGIAAVIATILSSLRASLIEALAENLGVLRRIDFDLA